jgi:hypothetical protein
MVFSRVGPNQSVEWGQIRVSKSSTFRFHWVVASGGIQDKEFTPYIILARNNARWNTISSLAYEHTCTFGLFTACRKNLRLKNNQLSTTDEHFVRRQE